MDERDTRLVEAYRQGYERGLAQSYSEGPAATSKRRRGILAFGTFLVGLGGVAAVVASRKGSEGAADLFAAMAITSAVGTAGLSAIDVWLGEPTPVWRLK